MTPPLLSKSKEPPMTDTPSQELSDTMLRLLNGHSVEQALHVAAVLGIADLLRDGPRHKSDLARATASDERALARVLRLLTSVAVFQEDGSGNFSLTALGSLLRSDFPGPFRDRAIYCGRPEMWRVWGDLMHCVRTGTSAFEHVHSDSFYEFVARYPEVGIPLRGYMTKTSKQHMEAILRAYDFSQFRTLVDVGGGQGDALAAILRACPRMQGVLFDLPHVIAGAEALEAGGLRERSRRIGGDMDRAIPSGGDGYLLKWILMDRSDAAVVEVLKACRHAMTADSKLVVVEIVLPTTKPSLAVSLFDMQMMLLFGQGRLRSLAEHRQLFDAAGFELSQVVATQSPNTLLVGARKG